MLFERARKNIAQKIHFLSVLWPTRMLAQRRDDENARHAIRADENERCIASLPRLFAVAPPSRAVTGHPRTEVPSSRPYPFCAAHLRICCFS